MCGCQGLHVHRHQYNVRPFPLVIWVPPKDPKMKFQFFTGRSSALRVNYQLLILKSNLLVVRSLRDLCRWALPGHCSQSAANDQGVEVHEPQLKALKVPQFSFWDPGKLAFFLRPLSSWVIPPCGESTTNIVDCLWFPFRKSETIMNDMLQNGRRHCRTFRKN